MTSIRRALLVRLLLGLVAVAALATIATYVETKREIGDLFDLQLKQLAYSTRIDDLLRGRAMGPAQPEGRRRYAQRTPAMAIGLADRRWSWLDFAFRSTYQR